jgi:hypothetical protein
MDFLSGVSVHFDKVLGFPPTIQSRVLLLETFRDKCGCPFGKIGQKHNPQESVKPIEYYTQLPNNEWATELAVDVNNLSAEIMPSLQFHEVACKLPAQFDAELSKRLTEWIRAYRDIDVISGTQFWPSVDMNNPYWRTVLDAEFQMLSNFFAQYSNVFPADPDHYSLTCKVSSPLMVGELDAALRNFSISKLKGFNLYFAQENNVVESLPMSIFEILSNLEKVRISIGKGKLFSQLALNQIYLFINSRSNVQKPLKSVHLECDYHQERILPFLKKLSDLRNPPDVIIQEYSTTVSYKDVEELRRFFPKLNLRFLSYGM